MTTGQIRQQQRQGTATRPRPVQSMLPISGPPAVTAPRAFTPHPRAFTPHPRTFAPHPRAFTPHPTAPRYTTAGTVYNPNMAAPVYPPVRRTNSPRWFPSRARGSPSPGIPYNQNPIPVRYPPHITTYRRDTYTPLQQNYDRAITPRLRELQGPLGNLKNPVSTLPPHLVGMTSPGPDVGGGRLAQSWRKVGPAGVDDGQHQDDEDPEFIASVNVLASQFNVKALTNLASYQNPSQRAAKKALSRARPFSDRPAASRSETLSMPQNQNPTTRAGLGAYRPPMAGYGAPGKPGPNAGYAAPGKPGPDAGYGPPGKPGPDAGYGAPGKPDAGYAAPGKPGPDVGCGAPGKPGPDARASRSLGDDYAPAGAPVPRNITAHSAARRAAFNAFLKTISPRSGPFPTRPGAPQPLTAGPPGLRKHQPFRGPGPSAPSVLQGSSDPSSPDLHIFQESGDSATSAYQSTEDSGWLSEDEGSSQDDVSKPAQDVSKPTQDVSKPAQDVPKLAQDVFKPAQDVFKPAQNVFKPAQNRFKPAQEEVYPDVIQSMIDAIVNSPQPSRAITPPVLQPPIGTSRPKPADPKTADAKMADPKKADPKMADPEAPAPAVSKPEPPPSMRLYYPFGLPSDYVPSSEPLEQFLPPRRTHAPRTREELDRHQKRVDESWYANVKSTHNALDDATLDAKKRHLFRTLGRVDLAEAMAIDGPGPADESGPNKRFSNFVVPDPWVIDDSEAGLRSFFASK
ncbi:hypothetical protein GGTG_04679 [Gaeumannomyces tritici R3-111a-1]|uniref:Uncharacterized protein n=1 Tax=Gaeumannomyces tritici (strain R3-111a-1) TaxID=644352 RepID=J3NTT0_GAET3|nr:hypothetical protein GGTG_04679 [Gaeumannomyces tritici R3-111a-1]EJT79595.1 hypothetical protein GGTG_04679 [Gaeumannomyces tritici R3-111a-1]